MKSGQYIGGRGTILSKYIIISKATEPWRAVSLGDAVQQTMATSKQGTCSVRLYQNIWTVFLMYFEDSSYFRDINDIQIS